MGVKTESDTGQHQRLEDVKKLASRIMHMHYCEHDIEGITSCFSEQFSWMGAGEQEYLSGRKACADHFRKFRDNDFFKCYFRGVIFTNFYDEKHGPAGGFF